MFCPKCGNEMDIFADKCLKCGKNFKSMSLAQRKKLDLKPKTKKTQKKPKASKARIEYNNGYATPEGMSITGRKMKKGSFKKRPNNEGIGFRFPFYGLGDR